MDLVSHLHAQLFHHEDVLQEMNERRRRERSPSQRASSCSSVLNPLFIAINVRNARGRRSSSISCDSNYAVDHFHSAI